MVSRTISVAVLTVSDSCSKGIATDLSGPEVSKIARELLQAEVVASACVPDDVFEISRQLQEWARFDLKPDLILTTGGTGLAPRDITPEATRSVLDKEAPGLMELARARCCETTPRAALSRGIAGAAGASLIVNLPGSTRGAAQTLKSIVDILPHAIQVLRDEVGRHDRDNGDDSP